MVPTLYWDHSRGKLIGIFAESLNLHLSKRMSEEKKFEKLRIKFEQCKEGRTVTVLDASKKKATEKMAERAHHSIIAEMNNYFCQAQPSSTAAQFSSAGLRLALLLLSPATQVF